MRLIDADAIIDTLGCSDRDIYVKACIEEDAPTVPAIPIDRIKQLREEIGNRICHGYTDDNEYQMAESIGHQKDLELIDNMIKEFEP